MPAVIHAMGMKNEGLFAAALPMAGGIGFQQETCGAVIAGALFLGFASEKYGRSWDDFNKWDMDKMIKALAATGAFYDRCKEAFGGTVICREITGIDFKQIKTTEEVLKFSETPAFETCCKNCGKVAHIVVETLLCDE